MTARERLLLGHSYPTFSAHPGLFAAGPKPWKDKDPVPYQGDDDSDGGPADGHHSPYHDDPGESVDMPPNEHPGGDHLNLRASLDAAAAACQDPEAARSLLAIEARLAEISLFLRPAKIGASPEMLLKLNVLAHIL